MHLSISLARSVNTLKAVIIAVPGLCRNRHCNSVFRSIVSFTLHPSTWISPQQIPSRLVVTPNGQRKGQCGEPPAPSDGLHAESLLHAGTIAHEGRQRRFEDERKVEDLVPHSLLEKRIAPGLADDEIGPLHDHDRHEESSVSVVF